LSTAFSHEALGIAPRHADQFPDEDNAAAEKRVFEL
jgi:hypothetical protein